MKTRLSFLIVLTIFSCKNQNRHGVIDSTVKEEVERWTYGCVCGCETGPKYWAEIEKESDCDGKQQSPINIIDLNVIDDASLTPIETHYSTNVEIHEITNNGHSIQYNFKKGDFIILNNNKYDLKQIHFHEPSEHTIDGIRYPLEMHLVHVTKDNKIAVLAIMTIEGESSEPFLFLEKYLPINNGETKLIDADFNLNKSLPENKSYYTYSGSLTTPPCTERVTWFVYKTPIAASIDQVKQLKELMPLNNYRDEQPINGRFVRQYTNR